MEFYWKFCHSCGKYYIYNGPMTCLSQSESIGSSCHCRKGVGRCGNTVIDLSIERLNIQTLPYTNCWALLFHYFIFVTINCSPSCKKRHLGFLLGPFWKSYGYAVSQTVSPAHGNGKSKLKRIFAITSVLSYLQTDERRSCRSICAAP